MLRKLFKILLFLILLTPIGFGQESQLVWQRTIGGAGEDHVNAITQDEEGNIYTLTTVQSNLNNDLLVTKLNESGDVLWSKEFGGAGDEVGVAILIDNDNSMFILGSSTSKDEFLSDNYGHQDVVLLHLTTQGDLIETKNFGGEFIDMPSSMIFNSSGNLVIAAYSRSTSIDLSSNEGQYDIWLFELNKDNEIHWQQSYGGTDEDLSKKVLQQEDGGYLILGESTSYANEFSDNRGDQDVLLIKTDAYGNKLWQKSYGGFNADYAEDMIETDEGTTIVAASTFSFDFDVTSNAGGSDAWLFEISNNGLIVWESSFGSDGNESVAALARSKNGIILVGTSNSSSVEEAFNNGEQDLWLYEIDDSSKEIVGHALYGSSGFDSGEALLVQNDGSILLAGSTNSNDGVVQGNKGKSDGWLLKVRDFLDSDINETLIHPNPTQGIIYLNQLPSSASIQLIDQQGHIMISKENIQEFASIIDLTTLPAGVYMLCIRSTERNELKRVVKM